MARKKEENNEEITTEIEDTAERRVYELGFHLDPELSESDAKRVYEGIRTTITDGGTIIAEGTPLKIQLAYTISRSETAGRRDFDSAYFCWIAYEADGAVHETITAAAHAEKRVIRFLDLKTTRDAALHAAEMRELADKTGEKPEEEEQVSETELDAAIEGATV